MVNSAQKYAEIEKRKIEKSRQEFVSAMPTNENWNKHKRPMQQRGL